MFFNYLFHLLCLYLRFKCFPFILRLKFYEDLGNFFINLFFFLILLSSAKLDPTLFCEMCFNYRFFFHPEEIQTQSNFNLFVHLFV